MATYDIAVCSTTVLGTPATTGAANQVRCYLENGQEGRLYSRVLTLPEPGSFWGMPDIKPADMAIIGISIASVWALAWLIRTIARQF